MVNEDAQVLPDRRSVPSSNGDVEQRGPERVPQLDEVSVHLGVTEYRRDRASLAVECGVMQRSPAASVRFGRVRVFAQQEFDHFHLFWFHSTLTEINHNNSGQNTQHQAHYRKPAARVVSEP